MANIDTPKDIKANNEAQSKGIFSWVTFHAIVWNNPRGNQDENKNACAELKPS